MSVEEDTELRDLVSQTLENNGVLAKIRAELRASVFLALEEQETNLSKAPFENKALKEFLKSPQAALGLCIVREFLEYLELDFTLSVYNTETSHGKGYEYSGRNKIIKDLQLKSLNGKKGPLLAHILQIALESSGISAVVKEEVPLTKTENIKLSPGGSPFHNASLETESPNVSAAPLDRTFTSDGTTVKELLSILTPTNGNDAKFKDFDSRLQHSPSGPLITPEQKLETNSNASSVSFVSNCEGVNPGKATTEKNIVHVNETNMNKASKEDEVLDARNHSSPVDHIQAKPSKVDGKNSMTSLFELPPLEGLQKRKNSNHVSSINFADLDLPEEYEEDFLSTDSSAAVDEISKSRSESHRSSNKQQLMKKEKLTIKKSTTESAEQVMSDKAPNSPVASISEDLEDNTNSGLEDLLNSTASMENTVDVTISHIQSNFADHIEEL